MRLFYNNNNNKNKNNNNKNKNNNNGDNVYLTTINRQSKRAHNYNKRNGAFDSSCKVCGDAISENAVAETKAYLMNAMKGVKLTMNPTTSASAEARNYNISITYYESPKICGAC
jgi:hypothetical protein